MRPLVLFQQDLYIRRIELRFFFGWLCRRMRTTLALVTLANAQIDAMLAVEFDFVGLIGIATKGIAENIYFETAKREIDFVVPLIDRDVAVSRIDSSRLALVEVRFDFSDWNSPNQSMLGKVAIVWLLASDSVDLLVIGRLKGIYLLKCCSRLYR